MDKLDSRAVVQIGIIVRDAERSAAHYAEIFGIPKPEVVPIAADPFAKTDFRGSPSTASGKAAFFDLGPIQMELIEPVGAPSTWEEFLHTKGEGIHHIALKTGDLAAARQFLRSKGMETIQSGGWDGGQYAYIESTPQLGTILELLHFD
jgi:catechol 2,3-dioxygenase-like lactoylglutathione lyase family enzyme